MSRYEGIRTTSGAIVTADGDVLDPRLDLRRHSPTGLEWGNGGSGPAQLALALLADRLDDVNEALALYQAFKWAVVSRLPITAWTLTSYDIHKALESIRAERKEV